MRKDVCLFESDETPGIFGVKYLHKEPEDEKCRFFYTERRPPGEASPELRRSGVTLECFSHSVLSRERDNVKSFPEVCLNFPVHFSQEDVDYHTGKAAYLVARTFAKRVAKDLGRELVDRTPFADS